ncbi:Low molecular weight protein tyrosine phosphatase [hydrothermal vent metagenome]|uniref:protein-tyrosine-phosphatase n=1 Tax=hydrothermal vent metagenome TaxID=652676 RepID=A0A3B0Z3J9_9ZZZZ
MTNINILFICMGNICRSPTAQGVFESLVSEARLEDRVTTDSAGTHAYHVGKQPDRRATQAALQRGIDLSTQRARQVDPADFARFDYVLAMDNSNLDDLLSICPDEHRTKVRLFLDFAESGSSDVPDPYYGSGQGFERVLDLVEEGARGLLDDVRERMGYR